MSAQNTQFDCESTQFIDGTVTVGTLITVLQLLQDLLQYDEINSVPETVRLDEQRFVIVVQNEALSIQVVEADVVICANV